MSNKKLEEVISIELLPDKDLLFRLEGNQVYFLASRGVDITPGDLIKLTKIEQGYNLSTRNYTNISIIKVLCFEVYDEKGLIGKYTTEKETINQELLM